MLVNGLNGGTGPKLFGIDNRDGHTVWGCPEGAASWRHGTVFDASILSDECSAPGRPNFTGAFVGMACEDMSGTAHPADFREFEYRERPYRVDPFRAPDSALRASLVHRQGQTSLASRRSLPTGTMRMPSSPNRHPLVAHDNSMGDS